MKRIKLNLGLYALVDDEDYIELSKYNWFVHTDSSRETFYAVRNKTRLHDNCTTGSVKMHRQIIGITDSSIHIDHIDGDGLNNQRANLRFATRSENQLNRKLNINNSTGIKGISVEHTKYGYISAMYRGKRLYKGFDFFEACCRRKAAENIPKGA